MFARQYVISIGNVFIIVFTLFGITRVDTGILVSEPSLGTLAAPPPTFSLFFIPFFNKSLTGCS